MIAEQLALPTPALTDDLVERFWRFVEKGPDCWLWTGRRGGSANYGSDRYGVLRELGRDPRREFGAHRLSYEIHIGPIPTGLDVCHTCDRPPCVNPAHLFLGTRADNVRDMVAKGRGSYGPNRPSLAPDPRAEAGSPTHPPTEGDVWPQRGRPEPAPAH